MPRTRWLSAQATAVVHALAEEPAAWRYGYDLCQELGIKPGSMYPILVRLADRGAARGGRLVPCPHDS